MKFLKIFFILFIPAVSIVGCKKSDCKPAMNSSSAPSSASVAAPSNNVVVSDPNVNGANARRMVGGLNSGDGTTILGSGDDDRDGGDKGKKKTVK